MKIDPQLKKDFQKYIQERMEDSKNKVYIYVPYKMDEHELGFIKKQFPFLKDTEIEVVIDPAIMAGIIIQFGTKRIDLSLRTELQNLKQTIYEIT